MSAKSRKVGGVAIVLASFTVIILLGIGALAPIDTAPRWWTAGAMALGLSVGLTTGMSKTEGRTNEFIKFVSTGVLVPILGAIGAFLVKSEEVREVSRYDGDRLIEKTTTTVTAFPGDLLHPFAVLGLFFFGFALFAVLGIAAGTLLREGGVVLHGA